ncbi:hypothetical protein LPW11_15105 [Geomonas sp. RF6]|uniref:hypothetical protein n=1 Tax=Geomonas sp. RF6 TaxID=2897342 RepID=UPI001E61161C|nr:hypothetical protein [Geomonas sp. RF6]UFS69221.1 hypothetical protein LPW11_15105 [Geomonas sp. RF6]
MRMDKIGRYVLMLALCASLTGFTTTVSADENADGMVRDRAMEMPVLTGQLWQKMSSDSKTAFIWGIGHVVTVEKHVVQKHPELKRSDFTEKLSEGLTGVPMDSIVQGIDNYYRNHPQNLDTPVMKVIWREMVKPKLKQGIADQPVNPETDQSR